MVATQDIFQAISPQIEQSMAQGAALLQQQGGILKRGTAMMMYYKWPERNPLSNRPYPEAGHVVYLPAHPVTRANMQDRKGLIPLTKYGTFSDTNLEQKYNYNDPFRNLLLKGGAIEFPLLQIRKLFWHRTPPQYVRDGIVRHIHFPQLKTNPETGNIIDDEGNELVDVRCPDCGTWFTSEWGMRSHQNVSHGDVANQRATASEMGKATESIGKAMSEAQTAQANVLVAVVDKLAEAIDRMGQRQSKLEDALSSMINQRGNPPRPVQPDR